VFDIDNVEVEAHSNGSLASITAAAVSFGLTPLEIAIILGRFQKAWPIGAVVTW
jgi:hypothetical protein